MGGRTRWEVVLDIHGKAAQLVWGALALRGAQEGPQGPEFTQGGKSGGRGAAAPRDPALPRHTCNPTSKDTATWAWLRATQNT